MAPVRFIQISDTHLFADKSKELLGVNTWQSFQAVVDLLQREKNKMDFILATGDLSQDQSVESYEAFADTLKSLNVPVYCVPGNHDSPKIMAQVFPRENVSMHKHIVLKNWHLILLNSHKQNAVEGVLDDAQFSYLQHCLQAYPEHAALIAMHHQPVSVGSAWLDKLGLLNAEEFWRIVAQYPKVNTVMFGHIHQVYEQVIEGIHCMSAPACCFQFRTGVDAFSLDNIPQGYRWIELHENGGIDTGVERLEKYVGMFKQDAKGY